ncbi:hypothetical protein DER45DRAFT_565844 [Fusarium avenaceum]|nr:hypothetical protein DER45DRAFT_565844 [Fusarium avenaceum]
MRRSRVSICWASEILVKFLLLSWLDLQVASSASVTQRSLNISPKSPSNLKPSPQTVDPYNTADHGPAPRRTRLTDAGRSGSGRT